MTQPSPPILDYPTPLPPPSKDLAVRWTVRLIVFTTLIVAITAAYCWIAARACQRITGFNVLDPHVSGTDLYVRFLCEIPFITVSALLALAALIGFILLLRQRQPLLALAIPAWCFVAWMGFIFLCFPIWDDISP